MRRLACVLMLAPLLLAVGPATGSGQGAAQPNPEICARCYRKLQQDNRDCQKLAGQDWQICREAAAEAYRRCSQGC